MLRPITPERAAELNPKTKIPDEVIESVNELLAEAWTGKRNSITLVQDDIISRIQSKHPYGREQIFENNWLDFEDVYEQAGWHVTYDSPDWGESYTPRFVFKKAGR